MTADLFSQRLRKQHLTGPGLEHPEDVVRLLGAVQSQDYPGAKWSLGQRLRAGTDVAVEKAFNEGKFLRTHVLRPTWHFVMPEDIRWMLQLTAPRVHALNAHMYRKLELDKSLLVRSLDVLGGELAGGRHRTREELAAALQRAGIVAGGFRLAYIMMYAELEALVCSGVVRGKSQTYALLEERAPQVAPFTRDEALVDLVRRFFTGHAPATLKHFAWWSGLTLADAKKGLAAAKADLRGIDVDGVEWFGVDGRAQKGSKRLAHFIPEYDEALVGAKGLGVRDLPRGRKGKSWKDSFLRPVVVDGMRAGTWRRTLSRDSALLETNLFAKLNPSQLSLLEKAAARFAKYLGVPVTLEPTKH